MKNINKKTAEEVMKAVLKTGNSNMRELFDVNYHEFQTFDPEERLEAIRYLLSFMPKQEGSDLVGVNLFDVFADWTEVAKRELTGRNAQDFSMYIAEYLLYG